MDEKELQEFSLDDIIKEFSDTPAEEQAAIAKALAAEPELPEEPKAEEPQEEPAPATVTDATIRLDAIPVTHGTVRNAQPIEDEEEETITVADQEEKTEPYSNEWEPEYEQPIAEYVPPKPIVFPRRSRLQELKRKLVSGPERAYYTLAEKGLGKLQFAAFFCGLITLISAVATVMFAFGLVPDTRLRLMVFSQFFVMLLSALLGCYQLLEGVTDLFRKRFSLNTLLVFTFILCCADGILCFKQLRVPCCAAFSLQMTMSLWSACQKRNTKLGQLDTMRKASRLDSIGMVENYYNESKGLLRGEGQVEHFMDTYEQPSGLEKVLSVYAISALGVSLALGIAAGVLYQSIGIGIQVAAVTALASMPASMLITLSRPAAVLERRLHALGAVICGWDGVEALSGKAVFPLAHEDLFPAGTVKMNGVKFFGKRQPDEIIAYAAALVSAEGGGLAPLFAHLLESRNGMHYTAEAFTAYEGGGIGALVNSDPVLAGSLAFLKEMGVEVPEGIRVNQAVCVAIEGELAGLFAITYEKDRSSAAGLATLCSYRDLRPVLVSDDFMVDAEFIRSKFSVSTKRLILPQTEERAQLQKQTLPEEVPAAALITGDGLAPFAYAATGARTLKRAATVGVIVHLAGGTLGFLIMVILTLIGALHLLTPANMFLYELVWLLPGILISQWTRTI